MITEIDGFFAPEPTDSEDVAWALQTAATMWARGDSRETVRWLRRAAEAASDAGKDMRAVALARAAAELASELQIPLSIAPNPSSPHSSPRAPSAPRTPAQDLMMGSEPTLVTSTNAPFSSEPHPSRPPTTRDPPSTDLDPSIDDSQRFPPTEEDFYSRRDDVGGDDATMIEGARPQPATVRPRQALRVAVMPSPREKGLLLVRPLAENEVAPDGTHEAILVAVEAGTHLLARRR